MATELPRDLGAPLQSVPFRFLRREMCCHLLWGMDA